METSAIPTIPEQWNLIITDIIMHTSNKNQGFRGSATLIYASHKITWLKFPLLYLFWTGVGGWGSRWPLIKILCHALGKIQRRLLLLVFRTPIIRFLSLCPAMPQRRGNGILQIICAVTRNKETYYSIKEWLIGKTIGKKNCFFLPLKQIKPS